MSPWIIPNLLSAILATGLLAMVLVRRPSPPLWPAVPAAIGAAALVCWGDVMSTLAVQGGAVGWLSLAMLYTGLACLAPAWWELGLRFGAAQGIPLQWARRRAARLPILFAALMLPVALSHPWHDWFLVARPGERNEYQAGWYLFAFGSHLVIAATFALYVRHALRARDGHTQRQALVLALATTAPAVANMVYTFTPEPPPLDPTPVGLGFTSLLLILAVHRQRLFGLSPFTLSTLIDTDPDALLLLDGDNRLLRANPSAVSLLGPGPTAAGACVLDQLAPRLADPDTGVALSAAQLQRLLAETGASSPPRLFRFKDERCRWIRMRVTVLAEPGGAALGRCLSLRDRTAVEEASEAATAQASVLEAVLASPDEGILVVDTTGGVPYRNQEYLRLFGIDAELAAQGRASLLAACEAAHCDDPEAHLSRIRELVENRSEVALDELPLRDGRRLERRTGPLLRDGAPAGRVWRFRDVTARQRQAEQLQHARELETLGIMAGGIAHDFNNVLAALIGHLALASSELPDASPVLEHLEAAERSADRAAELTGQLLACAGLPGHQPERLELSRVVGEAVAAMRPELPDGVELQLELQPPSGSVVADRERLHQVVRNLVQNAVEALPAAGGRVIVTTEQRELGAAELASMEAPGGGRPGPRACLTVADEGAGLSEETRKRVFEPFFTTKESASGLGLAAVHGIVRSLRGALHLDSSPGRGCRISVCLPLAEPRDAGAGAGAARLSQPGGGREQYQDH